MNAGSRVARKSAVALLLLGGCASAPGAEEPTPDKKCVDVTTLDDNWDNDMLCTRRDGTTFYTDYAGAKDFLRR